MRGDRDATVNVADDEVHLVVFPAYALSVLVGSRAQVERVGSRGPVDALYARDPGNVLELVYDDRVYHEQPSAKLVMELLCHLDAQHARVVNAALCRTDIGDESVVDFVCAAFDGVARTASSDDRIDACQVDVVIGEPLPYDFHTVVQLVVDRLESFEDR